MKIVIKEAGERTIRISLPTGLLINRATALMLPAILKKKGIAISGEQAVRIVRCIRGCRRCRGDWKLLEIDGKNGDRVQISL